MQVIFMFGPLEILSGGKHFMDNAEIEYEARIGLKHQDTYFCAVNH